MYDRKDSYLVKFRKDVQEILKEKVILSIIEEYQIEEIINNIYEDGFTDGANEGKRV